MSSILTLRSDSFPTVLAACTHVLRASGVLAIPTESFYALAASPLDPVAIRRLCSIKGRPEGKPILVLIAERDQLPPLVAHVTQTAQVLMDHLWPGPLTLIFDNSPQVPQALTAGTGSVGIRQVAVPTLVALLREVGPVTGTSANRSGAPPARTAEDVQTAFGDEVALIVDDGPAPGGPPSTILDTRDPVRLLREGHISRHQINAVLANAGLPVVRE